jgi:type I restriction enzyme S subunit
MKQDRKEKGNVPNLRFPEFQGEWEWKKLGEIADIKGGFAFDAKILSTEKSKYQIVKMGNLYQSQLDLSKNPSYIDEINDKLYQFLLKKNDIAMTLTGTTNKHDYGYSYLFKYEDNLLLNQRCALIRSKDENAYFLSYLIKTKPFLEQFFQSSTGGTGNQTNVSTKAMETFVVRIPQKEEQKKIGEFLSLIDERISTQSKIIEQYKSLIKGLNERLLSRKIRFKEFSEIWELTALEEVLIKNSTKNKNQKYSIVQSVSNKYGFINQDEIFEDRRVASINISNYYVIDKGCFAYNPSRIDIGSLAYKKDDETSVISPLYISFKANNKFLSDNFLWYWFSTTEFTQQMNNFFEGSVRNTLSYENLIKMIIPIPSLKEQTKIANFLSKISDRIEVEKKFLNQLEAQKTYLLQQMFI